MVVKHLVFLLQSEQTRCALVACDSEWVEPVDDRVFCSLHFLLQRFWIFFLSLSVMSLPSLLSGLKLTFPFSGTALFSLLSNLVLKTCLFTSVWPLFDVLLGRTSVCVCVCVCVCGTKLTCVFYGATCALIAPVIHTVLFQSEITSIHPFVCVCVCVSVFVFVCVRA